MTKFCKNCGKEIPLKYKSHPQKFCNRPCRDEFHTIKFDLEEARRLYASGLSHRAIGEKLGVNRHTVYTRLQKYGY